MIVTIDFETYYSSEYSLRKMSEVEYILDPRFQTICCAVKLGDAPAAVHYGHAAVADALAGIDWSRAAVLAHNSRFDGAILSWHYGHTPALYLDTLAMARALTHAVTGSSSLATVAEYLGLGAKGSEVVHALGLRHEQFPPNQLRAYGAYCAHDTELCRAIFDRFMAVFPKRELRVIDLALRMFIEPQSWLDAATLDVHLREVRDAKAAVMARVAAIDPTVFSSNAKFAALLESRGVEVPTKISAATGEMTWALARGDRAFKELCSDPEQTPEVQALLAARLGAKSTLEETRTERLLSLALREWQGRGRGWFAVPLRYHGAHTGRFSGDGGINAQNFGRASKIRAAIRAPAGFRIVHHDSSQIEARMVAWLAGCHKLLGAFLEGRDIYSEFASQVYRRRIAKSDKPERFVGKTSILGLGYSMGPPRFRHTLFIGNGGMSVSVTEDEAKAIVYLYRRSYPEIPELWERAEHMLRAMAALASPVLLLADGTPTRADRPAVAVAHPEPIPAVEISEGGVWLPNGLCVAYPGLRRMTNTDPTGQRRTEWFYDDPYGVPRKLFGGKVIENISQGLARIVITEIAERVQIETGYHPMLTTHDSLDYVVPEEEASWWHDYLERQFAQRPNWAPGLPLASEGGWGVSLRDAEQRVNA